jgi:hypothetical protein
MHGAISVSELKSISAVKPPRPSGAQQRRKRRGGHNMIWKRIETSYEELKKFGADPAMVAPLTRWVVTDILTNVQGAAGQRYAQIVRKFERYHLSASSRTPRSAALEPSRGGADDELEKEIRKGTLGQFQADAKKAKRQYLRLMKVLARYADPLTGRNPAKDHLDTLCLADQEPPAAIRKDIAVVLSAIAKEFSIDGRR